MGEIKPAYCPYRPTGQTATDVFQGHWKSAFPSNCGVQAGHAKNFEDPRVLWTDEYLGGLQGRSILELGPFEAYNTWQFSQLGCYPITAVEGNNINYLKCLVVKEVLGINATFLHGDVGAFLDATSAHYDLCWACGVLYHQTNPLALLHSISKRCDAVFLWTHFFDESIALKPEQYPHFVPAENKHREWNGYRCNHYYRAYRSPGAEVPMLFSGGRENYAYWLTRDDILNYLRKLGFRKIVLRGVNMNHNAGPTMSLLALRAADAGE